MLISFNLRLSYEEAMDCVQHMKSLGGEANTTTGGSWYEGTQDQIDKLLMYMAEKNYDFASMAFEMPHKATQRRVEQLKAEGVI